MANQKISEYLNTRNTFVDGDLFDVSAFLNPGYETQKTTWAIFKANFSSAGFTSTGDNISVFTNDAGYTGDQNIWLNFNADSGTTAANTTSDTFTLTGGTGISTAIVGDVVTFTNDAPNATHTGEVTGSGALTASSTIITNKTTVTAVSGDFVLISDTSDAGNLKKVDVADFLGGVTDGNGIFTGTNNNQTIAVNANVMTDFWDLTRNAGTSHLIRMNNNNNFGNVGFRWNGDATKYIDIRNYGTNIGSGSFPNLEDIGALDVARKKGFVVNIANSTSPNTEFFSINFGNQGSPSADSDYDLARSAFIVRRTALGAGNVGIGTGVASLTNKLTVNGTSYFQGRVRIDDTLAATKTISADFLPINVNGTVRYIALYD